MKIMHPCVDASNAAGGLAVDAVKWFADAFIRSPAMQHGKCIHVGSVAFSSVRSLPEDV